MGGDIINKLIDLLLILMVVAPFTKYTFASYLIFAIMATIIFISLFTKGEFKINKKMIFVIFSILCILFVTLLLEFNQLDRNFSNSTSDILKRFIVIVVAIIIVSNLNFTLIIRYLNKLIRNLFIVGIVFLVISLCTGIFVINENAVSFLILPYSGYIVYKQKRFIIKSICYFLLIFVLYLTGGRAALLAFISTPILIYIIKSKILRILFFISITFIITMFQFIFINKLEVLDKLLSGRIIIQQAYITEIMEKLTVFIFGSGEFILGEDILYGLGPHQTWIGLVWTYGIIGVFFNLIIILYAFKNNIKNEYLYLHLILGYILILQLFESIIIGGISYLSILLLIILLILLKKDNNHPNKLRP